MKILWRAVRAVVAALLILLLILNVWMLASRVIFKQELPSAFGCSTLIVLSGSMEPAFSTGDLLVIRREETYQPGDVIAFRDGGSMTTHRIVAEDAHGFVTRGDSNNAEDSHPVTKEQIAGRMIWVIPKLGGAMLFLRTPLGILVLVVAGILMIEAPWVVETIRRRRRREP